MTEQNQEKNPAVRVNFSNGLPLKKIAYLQHYDHYEDYFEEGDFGLSQQEFEQTKIMVVNWLDVPDDSGRFLNIYFKDNQIWINFEKYYGICQNLSQDIIDYVKQNKKLKLVFFKGTNEKNNDMLTAIDEESVEF